MCASIEPPISGGKPADSADDPPAPAPPPSDDEKIARLGEAFVEHVDDLWPTGDPNATPAWIAANVDELLATIERLYAMATDDQPGASEFLDRMAWLPELVDQIADGARLDGLSARCNA